MRRNFVPLLAKKRDGQQLAASEIAELVSGLVDGSLTDYQMTAFLMAVYLRGLDDDETIALTEAMLHSGRVLDLGSVPGIKVDKHSTGGVGDKISLCLAPLVAACGVPVPMVGGRGLGHTGGTLDKLEAIPGFRTSLSLSEFQRIIGEVGTSIMGQTEELAPADKRIYALRDVTATVESIPLIVASILSKKLAEGIDALVLDVKVGRGAFMKDEARALELAQALVRVGERAGKRVVALLTRMDAPLGLAIGNANETREAIDILHGRGPADVRECTLLLGAEMLVLGGKAQDVNEARSLLERALASGNALRCMERLVDAQGGDARVVAEPERLALAPLSVEVLAPESGFLSDIDALALGQAAVDLGAGRTRADQTIDPAVGIQLLAKPGALLRAGEPLALLQIREASQADAVLDRVRDAFIFSEEAPTERDLVVARWPRGA